MPQPASDRYRATLFQIDILTDVPRAEPVIARPERALWFAVLLDAIEQAVRPTRRTDGRTRAEAAAWLADRTRRHVGSFIFVCDELGLAPSSVDGIVARARRGLKPRRTLAFRRRRR